MVLLDILKIIIPLISTVVGCWIVVKVELSRQDERQKADQANISRLCSQVNQIDATLNGNGSEGMKVRVARIEDRVTSIHDGGCKFGREQGKHL